MKLQVELTSSLAKLPVKKHRRDAGWDICSIENILLQPNETAKIKTGLRVKIPSGYCLLVLPRSSFRVKGLIAHAVIDEGYTGDLDIVVTYVTFYSTLLKISCGERICQMVFLPVPDIEIEQVEKVQSDCERGEKGFGSTGKN